MELLKPIYFILRDDKETFENHWEARSKTYDSLSVDDIQNVLNYTHRKVNELLNYFNSIQLDKRSKKILCFYTDYVDHLLMYHKKKFDMKYHMQYMFSYSELLLGSQRYEGIMNKLREIDGTFKEDGSIT